MKETKKKVYEKPSAEVIDYLLKETIADLGQGEWGSIPIDSDFVDP